MRLSLAVNDRHVTTASLEAKGWLSAHVTLSNGSASDDAPDRVWLNAVDTSKEPNAVHSTWNEVPLAVGDRIAIQVLPDGDGDAPAEVTNTSDSPRNLFSSVRLARLMLEAVQRCDAELMGVLREAAEVEPEEDLQQIRLAIGSVIVEFDQQLISPTLRRHPELLAEAERLGVR